MVGRASTALHKLIIHVCSLKIKNSKSKDLAGVGVIRKAETGSLDGIYSGPQLAS